jgi:hypothetical protein
MASVQNRYGFADRQWDYVVDYCKRHYLKLGFGGTHTDSNQRLMYTWA